MTARPKFRATEYVKPSDLDEYAEWLESEFDVELAGLPEQHERVASALKSQFERSDFWKAFCSELSELGSAYYLRTGGFFFGAASDPIVTVKDWGPFWLKTYRRNVLENTRWPRPPSGGWLLPQDWYREITDVIRTKVVVRYLDGISDVVRLIAEGARKARHGSHVAYQASEEGYYAAHIDVRRRFEIPRADFDTDRVSAAVEIQVTTQVKDVIAELLHRYYAVRRASAPTDDMWQWDYLSDGFRSRYLGHMAHYLEGVIMDLRGRVTP